MLGKGHAVLLRRAELKTFVDFHGNEVFNLTLKVFEFLSLRPCGNHVQQIPVSMNM